MSSPLSSLHDRRHYAARGDSHRKHDTHPARTARARRRDAGPLAAHPFTQRYVHLPYPFFIYSHTHLHHAAEGGDKHNCGRMIRGEQFTRGDRSFVRYVRGCGERQRCLMRRIIRGERCVCTSASFFASHPSFPLSPSFVSLAAISLGSLVSSPPCLVPAPPPIVHSMHRRVESSAACARHSVFVYYPLCARGTLWRVLGCRIPCAEPCVHAGMGVVHAPSQYCAGNPPRPHPRSLSLVSRPHPHLRLLVHGDTHSPHPHSHPRRRVEVPGVSADFALAFDPNAVRARMPLPSARRVGRMPVYTAACMRAARAEFFLCTAQSTRTRHPRRIGAGDLVYILKPRPLSPESYPLLSVCVPVPIHATVGFRF
ncbi:hypothetical protein B0H16DRAFT_1531046 [Mycena metata]|uniref:Uncharacterized protein n=1 Tax=Mycena metata TaxID=1033252 RepID=A0AAD7JCD6_9AGAR|nr:hypothetical protein B0H16DRAFT_1531046 [Mycena metata]